MKKWDDLYYIEFFADYMVYYQMEKVGWYVVHRKNKKRLAINRCYSMPQTAKRAAKAKFKRDMKKLEEILLGQA